MTPAVSRLGALLRSNGVTLTQFEAAFGCAQSYVSRLTTGAVLPNVGTVLLVLDTLERLTAKKFDVREVWALGRRRVPRMTVNRLGGKTRLSDAAAAQVCAIYRSGGVSMRELAHRFGCSHATIGRAVHGKRRPDLVARMDERRAA